MEFEVGDIVKTKLYGNEFKIKAIHQSEWVEPYVVVSNEPYEQRRCTTRFMIDMDQFKKEWWKVKR